MSTKILVIKKLVPLQVALNQIMQKIEECTFYENFQMLFEPMVRKVGVAKIM